MSFLGDLGASAPVYVTRKTAGGVVAHYSLSIWMSLLAMCLVWLNIVVWGVIGLVEAVRFFS